MRKLILTIFAVTGTIFSIQAQDISKNAIGLRLGDNDGFGGEVSYQRGLSGNNRLEADLGWRSSDHVDGFKLIGLYQWVWNIQGGFNWYAGAGGGLGSWNVDKKHYDTDEHGMYIVLAGDVGIEYNFDFPLQLSLDVRPELYFGGDYADYKNGFSPDIALGIRYRWN